jgi:hypothetical protein
MIIQIRNLILTAVILVLISSSVSAQYGIEPELRGIEEFKTPLDFGLRNSLGFNIALNNFGFGLGAEYRRVVSPLSEVVVEFNITALRDITEQNYQFFGQQIIPNKRNRILSFPVMTGFKHRLFATPVSDNFRFFAAGKLGPTVAFVYPYYQTRDIYYITLDDIDQNFEFDPSKIKFGPVEANTGQIVNDMFQGWGDGEWKFGAAGQLALGVDFGEDFRNLSSVKIGYSFQYFNSGIQVMDPFSTLGIIPGNEERPDVFVLDTGTGKQKLFGSPFITLVFGKMW